MSRRSSTSPRPALRTWLARGLAATVMAALATTTIVVTSPALAAPAPEDVTWDAVAASLPTADLLDVEFAADGAATDVSAAAHALTPKPIAGTTVEDPTLGWVANLDGSQAWGAAWSDADYVLENDGASLEAVFKVDTPITSGYQDVIGNMQSAGFGIELVPGPDAQHGGIEIYAHTTSGGYGALPTATYRYGEWVHVIATFDGVDKKVYVNGDLISSTAAGSATLTTPPSAARTWIIGGDVDSSGNSSARLVGGLAVARIYSDPIDDMNAYRLAVSGGFADDTVAPVVRAVTTPADHAALNVAYVAPGIEAIDDFDAEPALSISVTGPDDVTAPLDLETRSFTPTVDGVYTLTYQAVDDAGNVGTVEYLVAGGDAELPTGPETPAAPESTADGVTDWKFSAIGDIHDNWTELVEAYDFWAAQGVETTLWPGDLTNGNTEAEYVALKNTIDSVAGYGIEHYASLGNHDVAGGQFGDYALFETATGQRPNADYVVNGYHVITVSPGSGEFAEDETAAAGTESSGTPTVASSGGYGYAAAWLETRLAAITAEEPEKPIFVLVHHPIRCTHYVSNEWYGDGLATGCGNNFDSFLEDYPQAVVWGGHIHTPNHIPTSIWQGTEAGGGFTTVNAPPLAYYEMESGVVGANSHTLSDSTPDDAGNNRETAIVEVDGSKVKITNYDLQADMWEPTIWEWDVADSLDESATFEERFPLGDARADHTAGPVWQEDDTITVTSIGEDKAQVDWTQAEPAPNDVHDIVQKYLVEVVNSNTAQTVLSFQRWSQYYVMPMPATVGHDVWNLQPGTDYEIRISPINAWAKVGEPLTTTFRTAGVGADQISSFVDHSAPMPVADIIDVDVETLTDVSTNAIPYTLLNSTASGPATSMPVQAMFSEADKATVVDGFTEDAAFVADGPGDVLAYGQPGALEIVLRVSALDATHGTLSAIAVIQGESEPTDWQRTISYGQPYHVALRFTGSVLDMWVNGEQLGTTNVDAQIAPALGIPGYAYFFVAGGSSNGSGGIVNPLDGEVTVARGFSVPLTDIEMARIAHQAQPGIDHVLPAVRAVSALATTGTTGVAYSFPALESVDDSGVLEQTSITVIGPWGDDVVSTTGAGGVFTPQLPGRYTLVYAATDGAGNDNAARYSVTVTLGATSGTSDEVPAADMLDVDFWNASRTGVADGAALTDHSPYDREFTRVTGAPISMNEELRKPVATFANSNDLSYRTAWSESDYALQNDGYSFESTFNMSSSSPWNEYQNVFSNQQGAGVGFDAYKIGSSDCFLTTEQKAGHDYCVTLWTEPSADDRLSVALDYDTWYQVVATNDLASERIYVNGELAAETGGAKAPSAPGDGTANWVIGGDAAPGNGVSNPFTGMISSARIWSNPLTPGDIAGLYDAFINPTDPTDPTDPEPTPVPDSVLDGAPSGGVTATPSSTTAGEKVVITVGTDHAGEQVRVWLHSTPVLLGTFTVSPAGTVTVTLPAGVAAGDHRLVVQALDGSLIGWTPLKISGLAFTGSDLGRTLGISGLALGLLLLGGVALIAVRRRRAVR
ncbi:metallophosphoesterase [Leifsonia sp. H3M29-4]|uniref:LamG-like jellyroll fold domain-containing protein n=1 Tax=Salinibacterium metalliresistens TaxID=3031321 RepID=UPI0023DA53B3|nr:LamG-like jellyroll fold domain-containing protein [Salinibacterium metalliresistens]MDF1477501.1 metallophosphoesterase [Salinibacterium metalliresistens]